MVAAKTDAASLSPINDRAIAHQQPNRGMKGDVHGMVQRRRRRAAERAD